MKQKVFTIYDSVSQSYRVPFFLPTTGQAVRAISDCVDNPEHEFGMHPDHYTLMDIGEYDDSDGRIVCVKPVSIGNLIEFKSPEKKVKQQSDDMEQILGTMSNLEKAVKKLLELAK